MKALIDSDSLIYKYAATNQEVIEWDENTHTILTDLDKAKQELTEAIDGIMEATGCEDYLLIFSPKQTFRYDILPSYKGNRKEPKYPLEIYLPLRQYALEKFKYHIPIYVEADDFCVWSMYEQPNEWVLCHIDKDLNQATGQHYNYNKLEAYEVDQAEADLLFYTQILTGDTSDGYGGCPGIGPKKAEKILADLDLTDEDAVWEAIVETYESKELTQEDALVQARMARMLRPSEYNGKDTITMWGVKYEK